MSMTREEFVLGLVRALPEAFEDVDVHDEYDYSDTPPASWEHRGGENTSSAVSRSSMPTSSLLIVTG